MTMEAGTIFTPSSMPRTAAMTQRGEGHALVHPGTHPRHPRAGLAFLPFMAALALLILLANAASAGLFSPVVKVNGMAVTEYEVDQRAALLAALGEGGDLYGKALEALIEDRLGEQEARRLGITVTDADIEAGMKEFAGRGNLELEPFLTFLAERGVAAETFRAFVRAGIAWRTVVQLKFAPKVRVSEEEIDNALAAGLGGSIEVRIAEIVLPKGGGNDEALRALAEDIARASNSPEAFATQARTYSAAPTRAQGGLVGWVPLSRMPAEIAPQLLGARPGQVIGPIDLPNAIVLIQYLGMREGGGIRRKVEAIDHAILTLPGGRSEKNLARAALIADRVDTCLDLQAEADRLKKDGAGFTRSALPPAKLPRTIALEIAKLDDGEISSTLTTPDGSRLMLVMLCKRVHALPEGEREQVRQALFAKRLESYARAYMAQLKADAIIEQRK